MYMYTYPIIPTDAMDVGCAPVMNQGAIEIARRQFRQQRWKLGTHRDQASVSGEKRGLDSGIHQPILCMYTYIENR